MVVCFGRLLWAPVVSSVMRLKAEREGTGAYCSLTNNTANIIAAASNGMAC